MSVSSWVILNFECRSEVSFEYHYYKIVQLSWKTTQKSTNILNIPVSIQLNLFALSVVHPVGKTIKSIFTLF